MYSLYDGGCGGWAAAAAAAAAADYIEKTCHNGNFKNPSPYAHRSNVVQSAVHMCMFLYQVKQ